MDNPETPSARLVIHAQATDRVTGEQVLRDDSSKSRWFIAELVVIDYRQTYTNPRTAEEVVGPWDITAVVSGPLITSGATGKRLASRTFRTDPEHGTAGVPDWVQNFVERYHPDKRA